MYNEDTIKRAKDKLLQLEEKGCLTGDEERLLNVLRENNEQYTIRFLEMNSDMMYIIKNLVS